MKGARRIVAVTLLALVNFPLISVAFVSDEDSKLPACCRRNGKHQCSMNMRSRAGSHSGPTLEASPCPLFPGVQAAPVAVKTGITPNATQVRAAAGASSKISVLTDFLRDSVADSATGTRGPPSLLS